MHPLLPKDLPANTWNLAHGEIFVKCPQHVRKSMGPKGLGFVPGLLYHG
jgi:hypothetical protein